MSDLRSTLRVEGSGGAASAALRNLADELDCQNHDLQAEVVVFVTLTHPPTNALQRFVDRLLHRGGTRVQIERTVAAG